MTEAARALGISRSTLYTLIAQHPEVAEVVDEERELLLDESEGVVAADVRQNKCVDTAKFVLRTQGKKRGWSERVEVTGANGRGLFQVVLLRPEPLEADPFADLVEPTPPPALPPPGASSWPPQPGHARP